ncbi:MAG: DsbE family thiol:disulfide interchange protein [Alphaproteobacteria bacterium]|jgi:cytochrome c biogenesis protein CcmG/thiol:disulfide interchange protein DsbE|tara:strand:- start:389 stop:886 length:498 start_codon:yes stop_codon:yes gene_type:complete
MRRFLPLIILLGVITLFLFGTFKKNTRVIPTPLIGQEVPIMGLETRFYDDFESNILEDILKSNKIKIINFWASWCLPCEVEHPILMGLSKKSDFIIIGVNYKDTEEGSSEFLNEKGNPYDLVVIDDEGMMGIEMGLTGVPETFVVNEEGKIIYRIVGPINNENKF